MYIRTTLLPALPINLPILTFTFFCLSWSLSSSQGCFRLAKDCGGDSTSLLTRYQQNKIIAYFRLEKTSGFCLDFSPTQHLHLILFHDMRSYQEATYGVSWGSRQLSSCFTNCWVSLLTVWARTKCGVISSCLLSFGLPQMVSEHLVHTHEFLLQVFLQGRVTHPCRVGLWSTEAEAAFQKPSEWCRMGGPAPSGWDLWAALGAAESPGPQEPSRHQWCRARDGECLSAAFM